LFLRTRSNTKPESISRNFMKTFIADIIPSIQRFSKRLDDIAKLTNQHWVSLGEINQSKRIFIFRPNNQLLISENGIVEKGSWEYLGNQSLLLDTKHESYLLKHGFFDENIIALKLDSTETYAFFINETKFSRELNNINDILQFLSDKYLKNITQENKGVSSIYFDGNADLYVPQVASLKKHRVEFTDGVTVEVITDVEGKYFIVSYYGRHYYKTHDAAIKAAYIYKMTKKILRVDLEE